MTREQREASDQLSKRTNSMDPKISKFYFSQNFRIFTFTPFFIGFVQNVVTGSFIVL